MPMDAYIRESGVESVGDINPLELESFIKKDGRKASAILSLLGRNESFFRAINTPVGKEILMEFAQRMQDLMHEILNAKPDHDITNARIELRLLMEITSKWQSKINAYYQGLQEIRKAKTASP